MCGILFVEHMPDVQLDPGGATLEYVSGDTHYRRRYPRHLWRKFLEREVRRLNEFDRAERGEVVAMEKRGVH